MITPSRTYVDEEEDTWAEAERFGKYVYPRDPPPAWVEEPIPYNDTSYYSDDSLQAWGGGFKGRRKKTRKKRGGEYSRLAKKLLKHKTRRKIKKTEPQVRKIQQAYKDYRERKMENERFTDQNWEDLKDAYSRSADDMLAPPPGYDPFWGSDEEDY